MSKPILSLKDVSKTYGKGESAVKALEHASLDVHPGELVALVGPSGSGKSTLLSIAGALLSPTDGSITLGDDDISSLSESQLTDLRLRRIGFIFQGANLVSFLTGRDQLMYLAELMNEDKAAAGDRADHLLEELGMAKRATHVPSELSGGERQRIAIARALMNEPELVLADEPTASLDSTRGRQVVELLAAEIHRRDTGGILVTHDERLIDVCDRIVRIEDGVLDTSDNANTIDPEHAGRQESLRKPDDGEDASSDGKPGIVKGLQRALNGYISLGEKGRR